MAVFSSSGVAGVDLISVFTPLGHAPKSESCADRFDFSSDVAHMQVLVSDTAKSVEFLSVPNHYKREAAGANSVLLYVRSVCVRLRDVA